MPVPGAQAGSTRAALEALAKQVDRLARRLFDLAHLDQSGATAGQVPVWNNTTGAWEAGDVIGPVLFDTPGPPPSGVLSPPYKVTRAATSIDIDGLLGTAGTSTTTAGVYDGSTLLASVSLASGVTDNTSTTTVSVAAGTVVRVKATAVGTGSADLTLQVTFR